MLRAEDLMIGDWVLCDGEHYQIAEIGGMVCLDAEEELFASLEDIEPIPLTPEILEKNGWSLWEIEGEYRKFDTIVIYGRKIPFTVFNGIEINYVHELQHALKLCEINLEIKL